MENQEPIQAAPKKSRLRKACKRLGIVSWLIPVIMATVLTIMHSCTRYKVVATTDEHGQVWYEHEDEQTTHIINYLAGHETLSDEEIMEYFRACLMEICKQESVDLKWHDLTGLTLQELDDHFDTVHEGTKSGNVIAFFETQFRPRYIQFSRENYDHLWSMMSEVWNPKVRWMSDYTPHQDGYVSWYSPFHNTVTIPMSLGKSWGPVDNLYAEWSHAQQFEENAWYWYPRWLYDLVANQIETILSEDESLAKTNTPVNSPQNPKPKNVLSHFWASSSPIILRVNLLRPLEKESNFSNTGYWRLYRKEGTVENNAHFILEPELKKNHPWVHPRVTQLASEK